MKCAPWALGIGYNMKRVLYQTVVGQKCRCNNERSVEAHTIVTPISYRYLPRHLQAETGVDPALFTQDQLTFCNYSWFDTPNGLMILSWTEIEELTE